MSNVKPLSIEQVLGCVCGMGYTQPRSLQASATRLTATT